MPGFKRAPLAPGPLSELMDALHQLHLVAGCPSTRVLQHDIGGAGVFSHTAIHKVFTGGGLPAWGLLELLVESMARRARLGDQAEVERFRTLWAIAARPATPATGPKLRERPEPLSKPISALMPAALDEIEAVAANSAVGSFRIPTGFDDLDALLGGWSQGCLIVVGGRPSSGKTTLLLNFCRTASIKYRIPSMLISGEMNSRELQTRIFSAEARVPLHTIRTGRMSDEDWSRLAGIMRALADAPIRLGAESGFRIEQIKTDAVRAAQQSSLKLLLVDGLQSITKYAGTGDTSTTEASLWGLKNLAEALKIPIIITAQAERHNTGPPTGSAIQHLRDSDAIERVADVVIMLDRPDQDDRESVRAGEADLIVVKNRNGPQATVTVAYQYHYCRFISMAPDYDYPLFRAEQTAKPLASNHDRKLFHRLLKQIPPDGQVIDWLKNNFMLKALPVRHFETIEQIAKALSLEVVGFDDKDANDRYIDFRSAVNDFCSKIPYYTWQDPRGNWLEVPTEWADRDRDKYDIAISAIAKARDAFVEAYDGFLLACHQKAIDRDEQPKDE